MFSDIKRVQFFVTTHWPGTKRKKEKELILIRTQRNKTSGMPRDLSPQNVTIWGDYCKRHHLMEYIVFLKKYNNKQYSTKKQVLYEL